MRLDFGYMFRELVTCRRYEKQIFIFKLGYGWYENSVNNKKKDIFFSLEFLSSAV